MEKFVYIQDGRAHWIFTRDDLPEWTPDFTVVPYPESGYQPDVGDLYENGAFSPAPVPPPAPAPVPSQVTRAQGKAALINAGLWANVVSYVESIADPTEKALAEVALNDTTHWRRDSPFLNEAATALGLSSGDLDDLFRDAAQIVL